RRRRHRRGGRHARNLRAAGRAPRHAPLTTRSIKRFPPPPGAALCRHTMGTAYQPRCYTLEVSRFRHLKNWPEKLAGYSLDQLEAERRSWSVRAEHLGHPQARMESLKRARLVEKVMSDRFPDRG